MSERYDAIVIGAGPNGLAAAIALAGHGLSVVVLEASNKPGGSARTEALTLPGFHHDVCSSIHPMAVASPFFRSLQLDVQWIQPDLPLAHPLDNARAAWLERSIEASAEALGSDATAYRRWMTPLARDWEPLVDEILQPFLHVPKHPWLLAKFGLTALGSADGVARRHFQTEAARALFAGMAAHSFLPLREAGSAAIGMVMAISAHACGWPMPRGGSGSLTQALVAALEAKGGKIEVNRRVNTIDELPPARAVLCDVSPRQLLAMAGHKFPARYRARLAAYRYGPGVFKLDYALSAPIPWTAPACRRAGTVHVGGTLDEIAHAEQQVARGQTPKRPFVLVAQHSLFDTTRAPAGQHTAWAYCHVPHGSNVDMTDRIEAQIERFAPGFRDCVLARSALNCRALEERNANLIGGDINGGLANLWQLAARPVLSPTPYSTPARGIYICSASTPPGGGVHGMCGFNAAKVALRKEFGIQI